MAGRRVLRSLMVPLLLAWAGAWACGDGTGPDDTIAIVRLTIGTQTVLIDWDRGPRSAVTIPLTGAASTQLTIATFHRRDGSPISLDPAAHEVRLVPTDPELVEFERTEAFRGNLRRLAAGTAEVTVTVVNVPEGSLDFGPHNLTVN